MTPEHNGHGNAGGAAHPVALAPTQIPNDPAVAWVEERTRVAVGRNVNVSGRLVFHEPVRIEGRFRGEVSSAELVVISEGATIEGKVRAPRLLVMGELRGDIVGSKRVVLGPHSRVDGNIEAESLTICEGAHFDGHVRMSAVGQGS
ncbi:MAG: bactofilin family protein [Candidatus Binataceae bacterium]